MSFKENNEIINSINLNNVQDSFSLKCIFKDIKRIKDVQVNIQNIYAPGVGSKTISYQFDLLKNTNYYVNVADIIKTLPESTRNKNDYVIKDDYGNKHHYRFEDIQLNGSSLKQLNLSTSGNVVDLNCSYNQTGINYYWKFTSERTEIRYIKGVKYNVCICTYYNNILGYKKKEYKTTNNSSSFSYPVEGYDLF